MPRLEHLYRESNGAFEILAIHLPINRQDLVKVMEKQGRSYSYQVLIDTSSSIIEEYRVRDTTTAFFIDRTGVIRAWHDGVGSGAISEEQIREYLKTIS